MRARIFVPFQIGPHPIQSPFVCQSNELEFGHRRVGPLGLAIPPRPPLGNDDLLALDRIRKAELVFELYGAALATEATDRLLAPFNVQFTESRIILDLRVPITRGDAKGELFR